VSRRATCPAWRIRIRFVLAQVGAIPSVKYPPPQVAGWPEDMIKAYIVDTPKITQVQPPSCPWRRGAAVLPSDHLAGGDHEHRERHA
jgi:hypothetical protein